MNSDLCSETVYSVEEEEPKQKSEEKNDEETANTKDGNEGRQEEEEEDGKPPENEVSTVKKDEMSETTEYDCSTDDSESLRLIYSSTDQSNCCSGIKYQIFLVKIFFLNEIFSAEICSRRSSSGSYPALHRVGGKREPESRSRSQEDLSSKMNLIERRKRLLLNHQSASLDLADT